MKLVRLCLNEMKKEIERIYRKNVKWDSALHTWHPFPSTNNITKYLQGKSVKEFDALSLSYKLHLVRDPWGLGFEEVQKYDRISWSVCDFEERYNLEES